MYNEISSLFKRCKSDQSQLLKKNNNHFIEEHIDENQQINEKKRPSNSKIYQDLPIVRSI